MTGPESIAAAVAPVVAAWLSTAPGQPLTLTADGSGGVSARIGAGDGSRITGKEAAAVLAMDPSTFKRHHFYGLKRGQDEKFSRRQVDRVKRDRAAAR